MKLTLLIAAIAAFGLTTTAHAKGKGKGAKTTDTTITGQVKDTTMLQTTATTTTQDESGMAITPSMESYAQYQFNAADVNGDGSVDVTEATALQASLASGAIATSGIPLFENPTVKGLQEAAVACKN